MLILITIAMIVSFFPASGSVHAMGETNLALKLNGSEFPSIIASGTCECGDNALSTIDGVFDYNNVSHNRWTNFGKNATEWLDINFGKATTFNQVKLYLFNDHSGVWPPSSYQIQYLNGTTWVDTTNQASNPVIPNAEKFDVATPGNTMNIVNFDTVVSNQFRVIMNNGYGATGLVEIEVFHTNRGDGTSGNPYVISTPNDFDLMRDNLAAHFVLANPIDLTEVSWTPIGVSPEIPFEGKFDGQGYSIKNLYVSQESNYAGLFGAIGATGVIENLTIDGAVVGSLLDHVGALAGANRGSINNVEIKNATISGSVYVGGLVGENSSLISNSSAAVNVIGDAYYIGGFVGFHHGGSTIRNSSASGNVEGPEDSNPNVGGLVGHSAGAFIINSFATGNVSSGGSLVGFNYLGTITGSYASGLVDGNPILVGEDEQGTIEQSLWKSHVVSFNSNGGTSVNIQGVAPNGTVTAPLTAPTKVGYEFLGWYSDSALQTPYDFNNSITAHTTIYAQWLVEIDDIVRIIHTGSPLEKDTNHDGRFDRSDVKIMLQRITSSIHDN